MRHMKQWERYLTGKNTLESDFQRSICKLATDLGWRWYHTRDSRGSRRGYPDLTLVHARKERLIFAELKNETYKATDEQKIWLADLIAVAKSTHNIEVYLWRPQDWQSGDIQMLLQRRPTNRWG